MHFSLSKTRFPWLTAKKKNGIKNNVMTYLCFRFNFVKYNHYSLINSFLVLLCFCCGCCCCCFCITSTQHVHARNKFM